MSDFFHMGGYAFYVWSSYGLAFLLLTYIFVSPILARKNTIKALKIKYRQQQMQAKAREAKAEKV